MLKRSFDVAFSSCALAALGPVLTGIAVWVKLDSKGPVFFRQVRVGRHGQSFRIYKFRTMRIDAERLGPAITVGKDPRVTRSGEILRKYKLDELPQFINVLIGDMSVVGPRPEVPKYVEAYPNGVREVVLSVRPGITDRASIEYRDENVLLGQSSDPERTYVQQILPIKLGYYVDYVYHRSLWLDARLVVRTCTAVFGGGR